ncbi:MAG: restriction endonuclease subunit S [Candidatus Enterosoma sp.]|nr:restriction endonuclease subunit S [Bacilli bacterium]MDD7328616.1 restriction endonuclease subunit S [bacterium]MDY3211246.1 restriction endonuclease subunit S [Candidatus Enterosoma sp.]MDD7618199.1 restriction endonuclease subunit S [bacterium]MDD7707009.1 restriction endonuclease subunit S [bacterium]
MAFEVFKFDDLATLINGRAYLMPELQDSGKYRIVRVGNFSGKDEWFWSDMELDEDKYCEAGDLLYKWACNFGPEIWKEEKVIYHYHIWKVLPKKGKVDKMFLYYYLQYATPMWLGGTNGTTMVHITKANMEKKKVFIPSSVSEQKLIASVLTKYDELIENNENRIKCLEEMANSLYKEWFIRFRFPGHEITRMDNGIPFGWEYKKFSNLYDFSRGVSYSTEEIECEDGINLINLKNIASFGGFRRDGTKKYDGKYKKDQVVKYKDLVMGVTDMTQDRRTVGAVALVPDISGVISADLIKLNSSLDNVFSYCLFKYGFYSKLVSQFGNGANVIHLKPSSIKNQKILIPTKDIIEKFVSLVTPTIDEIEKLNSQNDILLKQRDALLPRLMSGKLSVEGKEIL